MFDSLVLWGTKNVLWHCCEETFVAPLLLK